MKKMAMLASLVALTAFLTASPAFAYLDAGSGSMLLQLLLGGVAGAVVCLKLSWKWILAKFGIKKDGNEPHE